jgi:hypothetical protein
MYFVLDLLNLKNLASKVRLYYFNFWSTLIHQNNIIIKEHAPRDTTLYVSCDLIHHQSKKDKGSKANLDAILY